MFIFEFLVDCGERILNLFSYFIEWLHSPINEFPDVGIPLVDRLLDASTGLFNLFIDLPTRFELIFSPELFLAILGVALLSFFTNIIS